MKRTGGTVEVGGGERYQGKERIERLIDLFFDSLSTRCRLFKATNIFRL